MTTTLRPILPALLLALAACVVNTDDLKPKTDAECADLGQKACGPRCVGLDDPATGCANTGCAPCPDGPSGTVAFCDLSAACDYRAEECEAGKSQCDGVGGCEDLENDDFHCGACFHECWLTDCVTGICTPALSRPADGGVPVDLAAVPTGYIFIADGYGGIWGNGRLAGDSWVYGLGTVDRLAVDALGNAYVSSLGEGAHIRYVPYASSTAADFFAPEGEVRSMAVSPYEVWITTWAGASAEQEAGDLLAVARSDSSQWGSYEPGLGALAGVAYAEPLDEVVYGSDAGWLGWFDLSTFDTYASGLATPTQIAIFSGTVGVDLTVRTLAFWASEYDGSVRAMELPDGAVQNIWPAAGASSRMDIWADADGVYWTDFTQGIVAEWRAPYDDVVLLSSGGEPLSVIGWSDQVYWSDLDGNIRSVSK